MLLIVISISDMNIPGALAYLSKLISRSWKNSKQRDDEHRQGE
jgi:hypothetical protein